MSGPRAAFIVIDGADASGKATQIKLLAERLEAAGKRVSSFDFPRYDSGSSYFIKRYLGGDYGSLNDIGPYEASLFFALDRRDARADIEAALTDSDVVLSDRFTTSSMIHQGSKIEDSKERSAYFAWLDKLEFEVLGMPRPDLTLIMDVPLELSLELIRNRNKQTGFFGDIHEKDVRHQKQARLIYRELCDSFSDRFELLNCVSEAGRLLGEKQINEKVWQTIKACLP